MERLPGYTAPPGYDEDDDDMRDPRGAPMYTQGPGQHLRLLDDDEEPLYRTFVCHTVLLSSLNAGH